MIDMYMYVSIGIIIINIIYLIVRTIITYKVKITKIFKLNNKAFEQKMDLTDTMFENFEQSSVNKVKILLDEKCIDRINSTESTRFNKLTKKLQLIQYKYAWVENKSDLKTICRKMIKRNGFHLKTGEDLEHYISSSFNAIFTVSKNNINDHMDSYDCLLDTTPEERFNVSDAQILFRGLILDCISIEKNCIKDINDVEKSFNVTNKVVNLIKSIFRRS